MQMQTKRMLLRDIRPAAYNPRKRLEPGEKEYEALKGSIERWGLVDPLVVNARTGNLISGHQRYYILTNLGETETEAVAVDLDERQEKLLNVAMNKVEGQWPNGCGTTGTTSKAAQAPPRLTAACLPRPERMRTETSSTNTP